MLSGQEWGVVLLSLKVSGAAIALALPLAFLLAWLLARSRMPGRILLDALVHLPLVIPPVVTGWLLLLAFGANGPIGRLLERTFGMTLMFRWTGAALASAVMALPLMVRAIRLSQTNAQAARPVVHLPPPSVPGAAVNDGGTTQGKRWEARGL